MQRRHRTDNIWEVLCLHNCRSTYFSISGNLSCGSTYSRKQRISLPTKPKQARYWEHLGLQLVQPATPLALCHSVRSFYNYFFFFGGNWYCSLHISTERMEYMDGIRHADRIIWGAGDSWCKSHAGTGGTAAGTASPLLHVKRASLTSFWLHILCLNGLYDTMLPHCRSRVYVSLYWHAWSGQAGVLVLVYGHSSCKSNQQLRCWKEVCEFNVSEWGVHSGVRNVRRIFNCDGKRIAFNGSKPECFLKFKLAEHVGKMRDRHLPVMSSAITEQVQNKRSFVNHRIFRWTMTRFGNVAVMTLGTTAEDESNSEINKCPQWNVFCFFFHFADMHCRLHSQSCKCSNKHSEAHLRW